MKQYDTKALKDTIQVQINQLIADYTCGEGNKAINESQIDDLRDVLDFIENYEHEQEGRQLRLDEQARLRAC